MVREEGFVWDPIPQVHCSFSLGYSPCPIQPVGKELLAHSAMVLEADSAKPIRGWGGGFLLFLGGLRFMCKVRVMVLLFAGLHPGDGGSGLSGTTLG